MATSSTWTLDQLREEHANMVRLLSGLERQLDSIAENRSTRWDIVYAITDYCLDFPELHHHPKEDAVFRVLIVRDADAALAAGDLIAEHSRLRERTQDFAEIVDAVRLEQELERGVVIAKGREFLDAYRRHIALEDEFFFPSADRALSAIDWAEISRSIAERPDPLFDATEDRFRELRTLIISWTATD